MSRVDKHLESPPWLQPDRKGEPRVYVGDSAIGQNWAANTVAELWREGGRRCGLLLGHGAHGVGDRGQVVAAEVHLRQRADVTDGEGEVAQVVVGQVEAAQTREPERERFW